MTALRKRKIYNIKSIGEKLKQHRKDYNIGLEKAARTMKIGSRYLKMIENDDFDNLPEEVYIKKFLYNYAVFLNLNPEIVLSHFYKEREIYNKTKKKKPQQKIRGTSIFRVIFDFLLKPTTIKYSAIGLIFILVLLYLGISIKNIFSPPELIIKEPFESSIITSQRSVDLIGITEKEVELTINSKHVLADENGNFKLSLDLQKDLNIIKISAKKKHSKPNIVYRQIIVQDNFEE